MIVCQKTSWTEDEVALLRRMIVDDGMNYPEIAKRLDRSFGSVANKAYSLALSTKKPRKPRAPQQAFPLSGLNLPSVTRLVAVIPAPGVGGPIGYKEVSVRKLSFLEGFA